MNRSVLLAGGGVILLILILEGAGVFRLLDAQGRDLQQQHVTRPAAPMTTDIVHVDIDDGALQRIGRWPWPRALIADCINALHGAGARTIAVDLEFSEPAAEEGHDRQLADAVSDKTVLAVMLQPDQTEERWRTSGGSPEGYAQTLNLLEDDMDLDPADTTGTLTAADHDAFVANEISMKRTALWMNTGTVPPTGFAERSLRQAYLRQTDAERIASDRGLLQPDDTAPGSPMDRLPVPVLTSNADALGYVNISRRDRDGAVRSIEPAQSMRSGSVASLGAAAALHYLGHDHTIIIDPLEERLQLPDGSSLPILDGALPLAWPHSEYGTGWQHLLRHDTGDALGAGHLSIATIAELVKARELQEANRVQLASLSRTLLPVLRQDDTTSVNEPLAPEVQAEIKDEYEFTLGELDPGDELADHFTDPDSLAHAQALRDWHVLLDVIEANADEIKAVEQALHGEVDGKLVFIGWTATGSIADFVPTVAGARTPGVVVHAATANMMLTGHQHVYAPNWLGPVLVIVLGVWITLLVALATPWVATACSMVVLAIYIYLSAMLSFASWDLFLPIVAPVTSGISTWAACTGVSAVLIQRDKRRITRQFRARVSDRLVDTLIDNPAAISMSGEQREITVLFADLAGFTSISEQLGSERTVALVNSALSALAGAVVKHDGYVNKFLGDGLMAFWSAFEPQADQANRACSAAASCHDAITRVNQQLQDITLGLRLGVATGSAIVGDCGAPPDLNDYTAIGDTVNLAARLESANKQLGTNTLIDDETRLQAGDGIRTIPIGPVVVAGQSTPIRLHAVVDSTFDADALDAAESFQQAVARNDRTAAQTALEAMGAHPALDAIARLWADRVDGAGDLILHLTTK